MFERLKMIVLEAYDRIVGLLLEDIAIDECITKAPSGGEVDQAIDKIGRVTGRPGQ